LAASLGLGAVARADTPAQRAAADERVLKDAGLKTDPEALLQIFRQRTLNVEEKAKVDELIEQLGATGFKAREQATAALVARGPVVLDLLQGALKSTDPEVVRRAELCIQKIKKKDLAPQVLPAAARLVVHTRPPHAVEVLLAYVPFAENDGISEEVRSGLAALAVQGGKSDPALVAALADKSAVLRAAAGEALAAVPAQKAAVHKLLQDADAEVRMRVAAALVLNKDREAVRVLIDTIPELPQGKAWRAEDLLYRLAEGTTAPTAAVGSDAASRRKCRDAWLTWWKANEGKVDLAKLSQRPALLGYTLLVMLDENRIIEVGPDQKIRWEINNLELPLDVQPLDNDHVLVAEYKAGRVTERNHKGDVLWQRRVFGPLMAQRLRNGNTFIATDQQVFEVDRAGSEVYRFGLPPGERIMKAVKLDSGEIMCLTTESRVVRLNTSGKEVHSFAVNLNQKLFGGRLYVQPTGRVLVPHNAENKVIEYDAQGKVVWEANVDSPIAAVRLANGHTLVTSMAQLRAVELDRAGHEVWQYRAENTRVSRALRR
jgi:hypothetical protein